MNAKSQLPMPMAACLHWQSCKKQDLGRLRWRLTSVLCKADRLPHRDLVWMRGVSMFAACVPLGRFEQGREWERSSRCC